MRIRNHVTRRNEFPYAKKHVLRESFHESFHSERIIDYLS